MALQLQTVPTSREPFRPATSAELSILTGSALYRVAARVLTEADGVLEMAFEEPMSRIQRRRDLRRPCHIVIAFRALTSDYAGAWQEALMTDISLGGARLSIEPRVDIPKAMEINLLLPDNGAAGTAGARMYADDGSILPLHGLEFTGPVRARGRVTHCSRRPEGHVEAGIQFSALLDKDKFRLAHFLCETPEH